MTVAGPLSDPGVRRLWVELIDAAEHARVPCRVEPGPWGSDDPAERAVAASACRGCPTVVRTACAAYAEAADERVGVWGGVDRTNHTTHRRTPSAVTRGERSMTPTNPTDPTRPRCPMCSGVLFVKDPTGMRWDHRTDCALRDAEDATAAADDDRLARDHRYTRPTTNAEQRLLTAAGAADVAEVLVTQPAPAIRHRSFRTATGTPALPSILGAA